MASERSAARLAHRSGGPGVGSSNLPAPTIFSLDNQQLAECAELRPESEIGTKRHQIHRTAAKSPEIVPKAVHAAFCRDDPPPKQETAARAIQAGGRVMKALPISEGYLIREIAEVVATKGVNATP